MNYVALILLTLSYSMATAQSACPAYSDEAQEPITLKFRAQGGLGYSSGKGYRKLPRTLYTRYVATTDDAA